jgi:hypothetical protein
MSYLNRFERKIHSQNGEDGILLELIRLLDPPRFFVEFGVESGAECNTRALKHIGWVGVCWDGANANHDWNVYNERITVASINHLFAQYRVPNDFGILSIDIDGNDYHVWNALSAHYRPAIVVIEYNATFSPDRACTIAYDAGFNWDCTDYHGASFLAMSKLGAKRGYRLVCADNRGVNLFFVRNDLVEKLPAELIAESESPTSLYKPVGYNGHRADPHHRKWIDV